MRFCLLSLLSVSLCTLIGCGSAGEGAAQRVPVFKAGGTVTFAGAPVTDAAVTFVPLDGQPAAVGRTDANGKFTLMTYEYGDGAAVGSFTVLVSKSVSAAPVTDEETPEAHGTDASATYTAGAAHGGGGAAADELSMVPESYSSADTSTLRESVTAEGENNFDLEL
ncbi:MAG: hypothetical protein KDA88_12125 [Planctomycetaceae bacterium]|nr:hypothetical protein [Planctomycetaceae bacterium]MCB9949407.1 hypothetical protein [Planctomycetaceae bacterium]